MRPERERNKPSRGFTRLELLLTLLSLGLVSVAIAARMGEALERTAQKVTLLDLRRMGGAMQVYRKDYGGYPNSTLNGDPSVTWPAQLDGAGSPSIVPDLIQTVPKGDGWGIPYNFFGAPDGTCVQPKLYQCASDHACLWSMGSDRADASSEANTAGGDAMSAAWCCTPPYRTGTQHTHCYQSDIVWGDGGFLQAPEGPQDYCE